MDNQPAPLAQQFQTTSDRLWTPWRMQYIAGAAKAPGCLFCHCWESNADGANLVLLRDEFAFVMMNLFPYNPGHVMIVPAEHVASPEDASVTSMAAASRLLPAVLRALRRAMDPQGFNTGLNIGPVAGAGIADHMHVHVVPRWQGDANFMPILANTKVMPELIPVTYAKLRAELARVQVGDLPEPNCTLALLYENRSQVVIESTPQGAALLQSSISPGEPVWRTSLKSLLHRGVHAEITGWAGSTSASVVDPIAFSLVSRDATLPAGMAWIKIESARDQLKPDHQRILDQALLQPGAGQG